MDLQWSGFSSPAQQMHSPLMYMASGANISSGQNRRKSQVEKTYGIVPGGHDALHSGRQEMQVRRL
jgi:hypothetical protein